MDRGDHRFGPTERGIGAAGEGSPNPRPAPLLPLDRGKRRAPRGPRGRRRSSASRSARMLLASLFAHTTACAASSLAAAVVGGLLGPAPRAGALRQLSAGPACAVHRGRLGQDLQVQRVRFALLIWVAARFAHLGAHFVGGRTGCAVEGPPLNRSPCSSAHSSVEPWAAASPSAAQGPALVALSPEP